MHHPLFDFAVPADFQLKVEKQASLRYEHSGETFEVQAPLLTLGLHPLELLEAQAGSSLLEKFRLWSEGFQTQVTNEQETLFQGRTALRIETASDAQFCGQEFKITYQNFAVILDDEHFLDIQLLYETKDAATFAPLLDNFLSTLHIKGSSADWKAALLRDEAELDQPIHASEDDLDDEPPSSPSAEIPADEQDLIQIGELPFEFMAEDCHWKTSDFKKLFIQLPGKDLTPRGGVGCGTDRDRLATQRRRNLPLLRLPGNL